MDFRKKARLCDIESGVPFHARSGNCRLPPHRGREGYARNALRNTQTRRSGRHGDSALLEKHPEVATGDVEDVILGCAMPEGESGSNMARIAGMRAGLPDTVTGSRSTGSAAPAASDCDGCESDSFGNGHILIAGGSESMSMIPFAGNNPAPNPWLTDHHPEVYINMGLTAEAVATSWNIAREDADAFRATQPSECSGGTSGR